jgi:D-galactarolactone isomerase
MKAPAGACDCHIHIYEEKYPLAPNATFKPPHAPVSEYRKIQHALGFDRAIVVQPTGYGFDNRCTLEAIAQLGENARGIAVIPPSATDAEIERLHAAGIRGVRFMMLGGVLPWDALETIAARIQPFGWHINLQLDGRELPERAALLRKLPVDLVIDHTGKFLEPVSVDSAAFKVLLSLLGSERCWVKLSAPYETSLDGPPHYEDVSALARTLARAHPDRCLWATNWPHPNRAPLPSDAALLDLLAEWAGDERIWKKILIDNPARLYGF